MLLIVQSLGNGENTAKPLKTREGKLIYIKKGLGDGQGRETASLSVGA